MATAFKRASGILLPLFSLPGGAGIGGMGRQAYQFIDFLKAAGQTYWQVLPLCPTGFGDSPYQSPSTFAGNPYFIDLEQLAEQGFLTPEEYSALPWGADPSKVDYGLLYRGRRQVFERLFARFTAAIPGDFASFCAESAEWLEDYALFMAIKDALGGIALSQWPPELRRREASALAEWAERCGDGVLYHKMLQYFFYKQWFALKSYANSQGVQIIGDLPIYVSADSADVWAAPQQFHLNEDLCPIEVAGCPPDGFTADGQLWGNPLYDWEALRQTDFDWWKRRMALSLRIYDIVRIDHFRGFDSYYCIPYGAENAKNGVWRKGPGMELFQSLQESLGDLPIIAEDLGFLTESVRALLAESGFPGMKILQFAFSGEAGNEYLPHRYRPNSVCYTGTHDNDTLHGWLAHTTPRERQRALTYLQEERTEDLPRKMVLAALASVCDTCILPLQDLLGLGSEARINIPSTLGQNWQWRSTALPDSRTAADLRYYTTLYERI